MSQRVMIDVRTEINQREKHKKKLVKLDFSL